MRLATVVSHAAGDSMASWSRSWKRAATGSFYLIAASKLSASDAWADASSSQGADDVVAHWNGHAWNRDASFAAALKAAHASSQSFIGAINAVSPGNVYVSVSEIQVHGTTTTVSDVVFHRSGGTWRRVSKTSAGYYLPTAVPDGHGGWWATNLFGSGAYLMHESHGHWKRVGLPVPSGYTGNATALAHVPGTDATVAVVQLANGTSSCIRRSWLPAPCRGSHHRDNISARAADGRTWPGHGLAGTVQSAEREEESPSRTSRLTRPGQSIRVPTATIGFPGSSARSAMSSASRWTRTPLASPGASGSS